MTAVEPSDKIPTPEIVPVKVAFPVFEIVNLVTESVLKYIGLPSLVANSKPPEILLIDW